jgi:hypothetical protein
LDRLAAVIEKHSKSCAFSVAICTGPSPPGYANTIVTVAIGTAHQIELSLGDNHRLAIVMEPPGCLVHAWIPGQGLVTHTSYTDEYDIPVILADD